MFLIKATLIGKFSNKEAFKQSQLKKLTKDYYHSSIFHLHPIMILIILCIIYLLSLNSFSTAVKIGRF